ncbi:FxsB family cyclophane-forming radical SAM/SPASM peptide maturase [Nostoc sp. 'Peltigera membranacea cyanobiont' 232]|uniref:FxsB family cyclophane-forming radical SAM/SPASM peptide maturase n=1 Tax=Nostoc sp. 'Peltigera membranacea cyanobiont' 232 TaxID=2014531 RepID=UPI002950067A|nr:FxsB family cyclophane-forming radical SAM/SPASM peptide maturase [Nostoc sp. 'Peltigera membranacea cyanobiont' 232]
MTVKIQKFVPFNIFLWKISSRCNLNCKYCYVYNSVDSLWREQPRFMSEPVVRQTARRMREHCEAHNVPNVSLNFHGGEPLLGGVKYLKEIVAIIDETFAGSGIQLDLGLQSNGLLFTPEIGDFFLERDLSIGISLDGPPEVNDINRVDHRGQPTSAKLEEKLALLTSAPYELIFGGFLSVINTTVDPIAVIEYLLSFNTANIDFLLPLNNHDRRPPAKEIDADATPYADWLIQIFDYWFYRHTNTRIRIFDSIIRLLCGHSSLVEAIGLDPVALIVIETNGSLEAVDTLKTTFEGATKLEYNVGEHDFDTVAKDMAVRSRQLGADALCQKCKECPVVDICGGGYLPHRYSSERGFDNPSVYCADIAKLIRHIHAAVAGELNKQVLETVTV